MNALPQNPVSCDVSVLPEPVLPLPDRCEPKHVCCKCGSGVDVAFGPDPYDSDIRHDDTPCWQCQVCYDQSRGDI